MNTLLIESPDGKTQKININDAKPGSAITTTNNACKISAINVKERTHSPLCIMKFLHVSMKQHSDQDIEQTG